jgi:hypothetical protein
MQNRKNSLLVTRLIDALFVVVGRRTLDSFAIQVVKTVIKKLEPTFDFLSSVEVHDEFYLEGGVKVTIDPVMDAVEPARLGRAMDALIRVIYGELIETTGDDVGLYFITELKGHLGDAYVDELRGCGVDFEVIQLEQHMRYQMKDQKPAPPSRKPEPKEPELGYTWDTVSSWKYDNNVCFLFDSQGKLLDTLQLDLIIEEYVQKVTETKELAPSQTSIMLKVTEKEDELLEMLRRQDIDIESAVTLLHISRQKLDLMLRKLLQLEMLKHISENEVKITEKGLQYLSEKKG